MRKKNNKIFYFLIYTLILISFIFLIKKIDLRGFSSIIFNTQNYFSKKIYSIKEFSNSIKNISKLNQKINYLKEENEKLELYNQLLKEQNEKLKLYLKIKKKIPFEIKKRFLCFATVIGGNYNNIIQYIIIDKGENDGVEEGDGILTEEGYVAGRVIKVYKNTAKIQLITDLKSSISVRDKRSGIIGILVGEKYNKCKIKYVPKEEDVKKGDVIITSGIGKSFPMGIKVGEVIDVNMNLESLSMDIKVKPYCNILKLKNIIIVKQRQ